LECANETIYKREAKGEGTYCGCVFIWIYNCYSQGKEPYDETTWIDLDEIVSDFLFPRLLRCAVAVLI
jgi:hypothetical protein